MTLVLALATGCSTKEDLYDPDGDGTPLEEDCDSTDDAIHPGAAELCDGLDNDCDGEVDEGSPEDSTVWYVDRDGDGHGDPATTATACQAPEGYVAEADDCDDTLEDIHPDAPELCNGLDDDCDGEVDVDAVDADEWFLDADGDSFGDPASPVEGCDLSGAVQDARDCDDTDAEIHPYAVDDQCDNIDDDCDGMSDEDALWVGPASDTASTYPYTSIQDAVDDAERGAYVCVAPGEYTEDVVLGDRDVSVVGVAGSEETLVYGAESTSVFTLEAVGSSAVLRGFTITDGEGTLGSDDVRRGGGIYIEDSEATLDDLIVKDNGTAGGQGGGIYITGGHPVMSNLVIESNQAATGAGLYVTKGGLTLSDSEISLNDTNSAGTKGGGMYALDCDGSSDELTVSLSNVRFSGNRATDGAGMYIDQSSVEASELEFTANIAGGGGGILSYNSSLNLSDSELNNNEGSLGGGMKISGGTATLTGVTLQDNIAYSEAGGVYVTEADCALSDVTFLRNVADSSNGGGGLEISWATVSVSDALFQENTSAGSGGGILISGGYSVMIQDTAIIGNTAYHGAGIALLSASSGSPYLDMANTLLACNVASTTGGAISLLGTDTAADHTLAVLDHTTIAYNQASDGGAIWVYDDSQLALTSSIVASNQATSTDGAFTCSGTGPSLTLSYSDLYANSPTDTPSCTDLTADTGMLEVDPMFVAVSDLCLDSDFHLQESSPLLGAGEPEGDTGDTTDMGAYGLSSDTGE